MQKNTRQNNKKQAGAVQNVSADDYIKTPRAKFVCNPVLSEMIHKANLVPPILAEKLATEIHIEKITDLFLPFSKEALIYLFDKFPITEKDLSIKSVMLALKRLAKLEEIRRFVKELVILSAMVEMVREQRLATQKEENFLSEMRDAFLDLNQLIEFQSTLDSEMSEDDTLFSSELSPDYLAFTKSLNNSLNLHETEDYEGAKEHLMDGWRHLTKITEKYFLSEARMDERVYERKSELFGEDLFRATDLPKEIHQKMIATDVVIDEKGNIHFHLSSFAQALEGVNITRLRVCEVCGAFFWAKRKDAFACSKQHAKTRQMRLLRESWKQSGDLYLEARRKKKEAKNKEVK